MADVLASAAIEVFNLTWVAKSAPVLARAAALAARLICVLSVSVPSVTTLLATAVNRIAVVRLTDVLTVEIATAANCIAVVRLLEDFAVQVIEEFNGFATNKLTDTVHEHVTVAASSAAGPIPEDDIGLELKGKNPSMLSLG